MDQVVCRVLDLERKGEEGFQVIFKVFLWGKIRRVHDWGVANAIVIFVLFESELLGKLRIRAVLHSVVNLVHNMRRR